MKTQTMTSRTINLNNPSHQVCKQLYWLAEELSQEFDLDYDSIYKEMTSSYDDQELLNTYYKHFSRYSTMILDGTKIELVIK